VSLQENKVHWENGMVFVFKVLRNTGAVLFQKDCHFSLAFIVVFAVKKTKLTILAILSLFKEFINFYFIN